MKVVLINPAWIDHEHPDRWGVRAGSRWPHFQRRQPDGSLPRYIPFPFFLAIAATHLQQHNHEVLLIDAVAEDMDEDQLVLALQDFQPDVVFIETSTPSLHADLALLDRLKPLLTDVVFIGGGTHAPQLAADLVQRGVLDVWIVGEYDLALAHVVDAISLGKDITTIAGVISNGMTDWCFAPTPDVNALPEPLFEQLPMANYSDPVCGLPAPTAQSWLSRGCPFGCTFCVWPQLIYGSRKYRTRSIDTALDEVEHLINRYHCESFYFDDDTANIGEERMMALATAVKKRGLDQYPWSMMARADCMTPEMLTALADAGLYSIKYGVESVAPCLIDACNKSTNLERFHDIIRRTRDAGVKMHLTFTFGIPGETESTIAQTMDFLLEAAPETAQFSYCTPFPGTLFYEECRRKGWLTSDDWSTYLGSDHTVIHTPWLSSAALEQGVTQVVRTWGTYTDQRMDTRRAGVLKAVSEIVRSGACWTLLGEADVAGFLLEHPALNKACLPYEDSLAARVVIISRHDEEKLYRHLLRSDATRAQQAIRLYNMA